MSPQGEKSLRDAAARREQAAYDFERWISGRASTQLEDSTSFAAEQMESVVTEKAKKKPLTPAEEGAAYRAKKAADRDAVLRAAAAEPGNDDWLKRDTSWQGDVIEGLDAAAQADAARRKADFERAWLAQQRRGY